MGSLKKFNLNEFIDKYKIKVAIETGTGDGTSTREMMKYFFEKIYSIEIHKDAYNDLMSKNIFPDNVEILNKNSLEGLKEIFEKFYKEIPMFFYLDAHMPSNVDYHRGTFDDESKFSKELSLPLESELKLIQEYRKGCINIIICDDVRIYMDSDKFETGNWTERWRFNNPTMEFVEEICGEDYDISIDYRDQGYLILLPKNIF